MQGTRTRLRLAPILPGHIQFLPISGPISGTPFPVPISGFLHPDRARRVIDVSSIMGKGAKVHPRHFKEIEKAIEDFVKSNIIIERTSDE